MGARSVSILGNDTAQDLISEYQAAFYYNDIESAIAKIDFYVRGEFSEADESEWCYYMYSLADHISYESCVEPNIKDIWPTFQFKNIFSETTTMNS